MNRTNRRALVLPAVHPNEGLKAEYARALELLVGQMHNSVVHWVSAAYRSNPPEMLADASPAMDLRAVLKELSKRWQAHFDSIAPVLARRFAEQWRKTADLQFRKMLKRKADLSVEFRMTREMNDILQATVGENVSLIRSIAQQYFTGVEGAVLRSAAAGRDLKTLVDFLGPKVNLERIRMGRRPGESDRSFITRTQRRAAFIARDQANKATSYMQTARQLELGITEAVWLHSGAGKHPRPEHVAFSGKRYSIKEGAEIKGQRTWPGVEPNCRCVSKPVILGL